MIKRLLHWYSIPFETYFDRFNSLPVSKAQWNMIVSTFHCCGRMTNGLKQYYADQLMLALLTEGQI